MRFFVKYFSIFFFIFSISLFIYTFYKEQIFWNGEKYDYYLNYYVISILFILFSLTSFYLNKTIKEYLIISLGSIILVLYLFESYLNFNNSWKVKYINGVEYDTRSKLEIYNDLKKVNKNIKLVVQSKENNKNIFFLGGISNSKTIHNNENGYYSIYESDRYGFNNPDQEWDKAEIEYLMLGDSFGHGCCVNRPDDFASQLRMLSKKSVITLGYDGNGTLSQYASLREYFKPNMKKVILLFNDNDIKDLNNELKNKILSSYFKNKEFSQNLSLRQEEIDSLGDEIIENEWKKKMSESPDIFSKLITFFKIGKTRNLIFPQKKKNYKIKIRQRLKASSEFKKIIELSNELINKNNSKLYFVYLPGFWRYKTEIINDPYLEIKKMIEELGIPFIDIHKEVFIKEKNPFSLFPFEQPLHYNVDGYRKISKIIYNLTKN